MDEKKETKKHPLELAKEKIEAKIEELSTNGVSEENVVFLGALTDAEKDILKILKTKGEIKMYNGYGYGRGYGAEGYGAEGYGRRGVPGTGRRRYRGEEALDEMKYHYGAYQDSYNAGNYGAKEDSSYKMTEAFKEFIFAVGEELEPKDKMMFKQAMQEMVQKLK